MSHNFSAFVDFVYAKVASVRCFRCIAIGVSKLSNIIGMAWLLFSPPLAVGKNSTLTLPKKLIRLYDLQKNTKAAKVNQKAAKVKQKGKNTLRLH